MPTGWIPAQAPRGILRAAGMPELTLGLRLPCCWPPMRFSGALTADLLVVLVAGLPPGESCHPR